ncbi:MAG TPA: glycosyltransferase WbuB [Steroidobacteraceae bacterium]|jgi:colanic acid biosynthesis glycosyl transferase WcaI|nr:glycosyltransferase WbuB [Steroidobacteraceae bacterium]
MRILIYSANFAPEPTGIGKYSGDMALWLVEHGHEIRVVCAPPYYPSWHIDKKYRWPLYRREQWRGVDVWRTPLWVPKSPGGLTRILHLLSFALTSFPVMLWQIAWRPDVVLTVAPAFMCAPAGLLTAWLCRAQRWLHLQDFEVDVAFRMGLLKGRLLQRIALRMEGSLLRRFDTVSTISGRMMDRLRAKGVTVGKTRYLPNWIDLARIKPPKNGSYRNQLGISENAILVLFSGTLSGKQGLMVIPETAKLLKSRPEIVFIVCGEGIMKPQLESAAAGLLNIRFLPLQPPGRVSDLLGSADIHLLPQSPDAADLVLPSKLSGMMASGRPVIATCRAGTEISEIVSQCGLVVAPENSVELAHAISVLADDPETRALLGRRGRIFAEENFERDAVLSSMFAPGQVENDGHLAHD